MPALVAVVARHAGAAAASVSTITLLRAVTRDVPGLAAVVAGRLVGALVAVTSNVTYTIAAVAAVTDLVFLAFTGEVAKSVALVALVPAAAAATTASAAAVAATAAAANLALTGVVSRLIALVAHGAAHGGSAQVMRA